jgi:hypothetical protein
MTHCCRNKQNDPYYDEEIICNLPASCDNYYSQSSGNPRDQSTEINYIRCTSRIRDGLPADHVRVELN